MPNENTVTRSATAAVPAGRLDSVDAYRGFVMFLMMAETLRLSSVAAAIPGSGFWAFLAEQQSHVEWIGVFAARSDSTVVHVSRGRRAAVFHRQPPQTRAIGGSDDRSRLLASVFVDCTWHLSAKLGALANAFHV